jgi:hypothetical protein
MSVLDIQYTKGDFVMVDPKKASCWNTIPPKSQRRLELFAEGKFEVGTDEIKTVEITTPRQVLIAFAWTTFHLGNNGEAYILASHIMQDHLRKLFAVVV